MTRVEWSKIGNRDPVEQNTYRVETLAYEYGTSLNNNPKVNWEYKIVGPEENEFIGRHVWDTFTLTPKALWRLGWFVNALGINTKGMPDMNSGTEEFNKVMELCKGRTLWVNVIVDAYQGKPRNKVTEYVQDDQQIPMDKVDLDDIPSWLKNKAKEQDPPF